MTLPEKKDLILKFINKDEKTRSGRWSYPYFVQIFPKDEIQHERDILFLCEEMYLEGIINLDGINVTWTPKVEIILGNGGYTQIEIDKANKRLEERMERELNIEKLKYDLKNSKRIYKTYWWTFATALTALTISIIILIIQLTKSN